MLKIDMMIDCIFKNDESIRMNNEMKKLLITSAIISAILMGIVPVSIPGLSQTQEIGAAQ